MKKIKQIELKEHRKKKKEYVKKKTVGERKITTKT